MPVSVRQFASFGCFVVECTQIPEVSSSSFVSAHDPTNNRRPANTYLSMPTGRVVTSTCQQLRNGADEGDKKCET